MRLFLAILIGKLILLLTRTLKIGGGSAAPGLYALKVDPTLVNKLSQKIPTNIIITGTNGKTTTARILAHLAKESGLRVIRNSTGSNLERGVASALIANWPLIAGNQKYDLGVWELDEAAFNKVAPKLKPKLMIFLNIFRDQLDRYGEIDSIISKWAETLKQLDQEATILINGDDTKVSSLRMFFKGKSETFGVENFKIIGESLEETTLNRKLDFEARDVVTNGLESSIFSLKIDKEFMQISLPIPGIYHIYDAVAALGAAHHLGIQIHRYTDSLINFQPAFGRMEKIKEGIIFLIKNPAGTTQVIETIKSSIKPEDKLLIALNDNFADGTDVSWIWDAEFEKFKIQSSKFKVICSGTRANDLAIRLKYAGFSTNSLDIELDLEKAFKDAKMALKGTLFVLPTYTALLELQEILAEVGEKKHYWKEEGS